MKKKITFFGSGIELENYTLPLPEIDSVVETLEFYYQELIFGGTDIGVMGAFASKCKEKGLKVTSIVPKFFAQNHPNLIFSQENLILADSLSDRKDKLNNGDCILCYPGGIGTLDEITDILAKISLSEMEKKPILLYNFERFFSPFLLQLEVSVKTGLIKKELMENIYTFETVDQFKKILKEINK